MAYRATERTEARKALTRERIVAGALAQLAEGGYASASVQAVARRSGVATGSVYRYFPSKVDLFAEVFRRASQAELDTVASLTRGGNLPARERIGAAIETFARRALASPIRAYALIAEPVDPAIESERLAFRRGYRDAFAAALEDGIAAGEIAPCDTQTVAAAIVGALAEALVGPLSPASDRHTAMVPEGLIAALVHFCLNAIDKEPESRWQRSRTGRPSASRATTRV
jgi:AcrR family transcriptional regulator